MKHFKSILAMVLALVMILSCVGTAFAAKKTEIKDIAYKGDAAEKKDTIKGFKSEAFLELNSYQYADDEIVRAIVILEGEPEADVAEVGSEKAAAHRVKLVNQHNAVRKAMGDIRYQLKFDFTRLLNGFSCDVAYGDLETIAAIEGVKAVHIANSYAVPEVTVAETPAMDYANGMTGNYYMNTAMGADGAGIVVAVLDTGLATDHEAFQDEDGLAAASAKLSKEDVEALSEELWGKGAYLSAKVPFAYDYADKDADVTDKNGHGTHVSGIAVGYATTTAEDGAVTVDFCGAAPAAQLLSMKIFYDGKSGTTSDIYFYALEDAYTLGADVVNMSIGAQNGFTYDASLESEVFGNIYQRMVDAGIVMSVAAGNEYSMAEYSSAGYIGAEYTDYGTIASPATYEGNVSVASVENFAYPSLYTLTVNGETFEYVDSAKNEEDMWIENFGGKTVDYVTVLDADGYISLGKPEDYANVDVKGKIAVVSRGDLAFEEKVEYAYNAGAIGCIVVNNQSGIISMAIETFEVPAISITYDALEAFMTATEGQIEVADSYIYVENANGYLMSEFSNWGTSPNLTLDPSITSVGGMVYSAVPGAKDSYEVYSGTSMAAPNATGTFANLLTAIYDKYPEISKKDAAEMAKSLLESSAEILFDADGYLYSPRKQGAGLANALVAATLEDEAAYISNPLVELGDDAEKTGTYSFELELVNNTDEEVQYFADGIAMYDYLYDIGSSSPLYANTLTSDYLLYTNFTIDNEDASRCFNDEFVDCFEDYWYHEYVDYMVYNGYMKGISATEFAPNSPLTRGMVVTVLWRMAGSPKAEEAASFADVAADAWYADAVAWAQANGIVNGISATEFAPDMYVTREQIATILWRYMGSEEIEMEMGEFKDCNDVSDYAKTAMVWAVANGLYQGYNGMLKPQANATRAEFAAIMTRFEGGMYPCNSVCVIVPANSTKKVGVTITLDEYDMEMLDYYFPNGTFIEGFVEFYNNKYSTHATFLAYYGNWNDGAILEETDYVDIIEANNWLNTTVADTAGNTYADYGYTYADLLTFYTKPNLAYAADTAIESGSFLGNNMLDYVEYNPDHAAFSTPLTDGTYNYYEVLYMEPYMLRNLEHLIMTVSNKETGEVYYVDDTQYLPKAVYDTDYASWFATGAFYWDGKDANGEYVPSGTVATVTYDAVLPYNQKEVKGIWGMDVTVDYTAPTLDSVEFDAEAGTITVTATDENYLQAIYLSNASYEILDFAAYSSDTKGESFTVTFDVNEYIEDGETALWVVGFDYATNEMEQKVDLIETGKAATITLVTPNGTETIDVLTGDTYVFEAAEAIEGRTFMLWATEEVESATSEEIYYVGGDWYFEGDELTVIEEEYTFYSLYAVGKEEALEKANYYMDYDSDYSGDWAICGWNITDSGKYDTTNPIALDNTGADVVVADIEDAEVGDTYIEFYTNEDSIRYTITKVGTASGYNIYTIQSAADGKYMTLGEDMSLTYTTDMAAGYSSYWLIMYGGNGYDTYIYNLADTNAFLAYDCLEETFDVFDDSVPYMSGYDYVASDLFFAALYRCEDTTLVVDYYTTK